MIVIALLNIKDWKRYDVRRRLLRMGILITGFLSLMIALFTFYGQFSGNFVMSVTPDSYKRGIILSEKIDFIAPTPRLLATPLNDASDVTYSWLDIEAVKNAEGDYFDPTYMYLGYSFYIKNSGDETVAIDMVIDIKSVHFNVDEAIRVLIINDESEIVYQKADKQLTVYPEMSEVEVRNFLSNTRVCEQKINSLRPEEIKKYSILLWIEGEDPDCTDKIRGGQVKMQMVFRIAGV